MPQNEKNKQTKNKNKTEQTLIKKTRLDYMHTCFSILITV